MFTRPWKISMPLHRQNEHDADSRVPVPGGSRKKRTARSSATRAPGIPSRGAAGTRNAAVSLPRAGAAGGRPKPSPRDDPAGAGRQAGSHGLYQPDGGGANYGLETRARDFFTPESRGIVVDPPDGKLPYQTWARAERESRALPERGYDDPTAHCFVAGVPRSHVRARRPFQILQPPGYVVMLFERMSWRQIPLDGRAHLPDHVRLWQGDSVGRWEGDTLVVETTNLNGKTWLNEVGDVVSHAETVVERSRRSTRTRLIYEATVTDPIAYTRPWTIEVPINKADRRAARGRVSRGQRGPAAPEGRQGRISRSATGEA